ncbi:hypothetical protein DFH06DRAFT_1399061, partial [Mycena polygramma]
STPPHSYSYIPYLTHPTSHAHILPYPSPSTAHTMSHLTTALLGCVSRFFSTSPAASARLSHSKSDPDLLQHMDTHLRPASSTGVRPRPASAMSIEGPYWGWDAGTEGTTLRRRTRTERDVGLKAPADVKITHSSNSPVLACQPPRPARPDAPFPTADAAAASVPEDLDAGCASSALADALSTLKRPPTTAPAPAPVSSLERRADADSSCDTSLDLSLDLSLDISLISDTSAFSVDDSEGDLSGLFVFTLPPPPTLIADTSASSSADESDGELSFGSFHFALPPPILPSPSHPPSTSPAPPLSNTAPGAALKPIGLGLSNLYKPSGAPFDGMGVLSFGVCGSHSSSGSPYNAAASPSHSSSRCHSPPTPRLHAPTHPDGLSRTFLEKLEATWAADPHHLGLGVIDEEPYVLDCAGEDADHGISLSHSERDTDESRSRSRGGNKRKGKTRTTTSRGVDRDTISSGLKRKPVSGITARGARRGAWHVRPINLEFPLKVDSNTNGLVVNEVFGRGVCSADHK